MWYTTNNKELREKLKQITENKENHGHNVGVQLRLIENISHCIPHSIAVVEEAHSDDVKSWQYNCFMYAFDLRNKFVDQKYIIKDIFPNSKFVRHLVDNSLSEIDLKNAKNADYVIYFDGDQAKHAGKINNYKIISKWGTAHRWSHALFEVPSDYGEGIKFFKKISEDNIYSIFNQWAKNQLITRPSFSDIENK